MEKVKPSFERSYNSPTVVPFEKGKLPPQAIDLEEVVLGAMMIDKKGVDAVIDILHHEAFYK
jgi:replicative DNA helicase